MIDFVRASDFDDDGKTVRTDDCRYCDGLNKAETVDYYGNTVWACAHCGAIL